MMLQELAATAVANPSPSAEKSVSDCVEKHLFFLCRTLLRAIPTEDQMQEARIAALEALRAFNPARAKFTTILPLYLRKALFRQQQPQLIRLPEYQRLLLLKLDALTARFYYTVDRAPTDAEIGAALGLNEEQVTQLHQTVAVVFSIGEQDEAGPDPYVPIDTKLDVRAAVARLERSQPLTGRIVRLHYIEGKGYRTIASLLRCSHSTVLHHLEAGRTYLREHLADYA